MAGKDDLDWDDLRYFLRAAQSGTLSGAARALGVEHTTVGRRLTSLERSFGAPLVIRRADGLQLTSLGERLLPLVEGIARSVLAVMDEAAGCQTRVRLAVPSGFAALLSGRIAQWRRENPEIAIELLSGSRPVDLKRGEADLALRMGPVTDEDLVAQNLGEAGWSLYAADRYLARRPAPDNPRNLAGHEVIGFDDSIVHVPGARWIAEHGKGATIVLRNREMTDMLAAATSGLGLAVLPCMLAETEPSLRRLTDEVLGSHRISLVYRREMLRAQAVRKVIALVVGAMREHADRLSGARSPTTVSGPRGPLRR
ncbi:MAG TPA: LysR family transcriptional regulator [Burkholderiales bacterium]|jgi:DNA-binding transcriptional LysR family regulator|nr:LysR family transcriptional regulator [Burkholderiales bacterium]